MIKYTQQYLTKLEGLLKENLYEVRYEKGNFRSGYCIVEDKKVVVVNKFATIESRIQALYEIAQTLLAQGRLLHDEQKLFLKKNISSAEEEIASSEAETASLEEKLLDEPAVEPTN